MRRSAYPFLAVSSAGIALAGMLSSAVRLPHYGGTLRVEIQAKASSLDPAEASNAAEANAIVRLRDLIYSRLVRLDRNGQPQPSVSLAWEHDARSVNWHFKLRRGVKWQDGTPLTPEEVLSTFEGLAPGGSVHLANDTLEIDTGRARPDLLMALATEPRWMIRRPVVASDAVPLGTGPFHVKEWQRARRAVLEANEDYWDSRPYVDAIEIRLGRPSHDQLLDLELGKADVVELDPSDARRAQQEGKRVWISAPVDLLFLRFDLNRPPVQDQRLREAVAASIDRLAIQKVLAQSYGEVAGGIFPQWLSGYSFLFSTAMDLNRARELARAMPTPPTLKLGYDPNDALTSQIAERIAVNARDAGLTLRVAPLPLGWLRMPDTGTDARVERVRIGGPTLGAAVRQATSKLGLSTEADTDSPEQVYGAERKLAGSFTDVPLLYVPELVGLAARVRGWSPTTWGDWHLENVSLEAEQP